MLPIIQTFWLGMKVELEFASWHEIRKQFSKKQIYIPNKKISLNRSLLQMDNATPLKLDLAAADL